MRKRLDLIDFAPALALALALLAVSFFPQRIQTVQAAGIFDPQSLGKVTVATAGTPVSIKTSGFLVHGVTIQSDPSNAGTFMTVKDANGNIMAKLTKGQSFTPPQRYELGLDLKNLQLDTDTNGDGCYVSYF